ncbi:Ribosomal RNA small subunit methyltransferase A [Bacillus cereus Rock4-18]|nr:Ribosomal RNA small subunit methyltransferase A [Bacillus cereus Rock4-18]
MNKKGKANGFIFFFILFINYKIDGQTAFRALFLKSKNK